MGKTGVCPADTEKHKAEAVNQHGQHAQVTDFRPVHGKQKGIDEAKAAACQHGAQQLGKGLGRSYPRSRFSHPPV